MADSGQAWESLTGIIPKAEADAIRGIIKTHPFRRLSTEPEVSVSPKALCQSVHIVAEAGPKDHMIGGESHSYFRHTLETVGNEIDELLEYGINRLYLQLYPRDELCPEKSIEHHAKVIETLRKRYGGTLMLAVGTVGLFMGQDLRWGVRGSSGGIDVENTLGYLADATVAMAQSGCDAVATVGRINYEAQVARAALDSVSDRVQLWGFSTNTETPNAYFDSSDLDVKRRDTGQKIIVGNCHEMLLRALRDIYEGVDVVLQKPMENLAVLVLLRLLADGKMSMDDVFAWPQTEELVSRNGDFVTRELATTDAMRDSLSGVSLGAYEVSGTYAIYRMVEDLQSTALARALFEEQLKNITFSAGHRLSQIVTRNGLWFVRGMGK